MEPDVGVSVPPSALREKWQKKKKNPSGLRESCLPLGLSLKLFPPLEMLFLLAPTHSLTMGLLSCCAYLGLSTHRILYSMIQAWLLRQTVSTTWAGPGPPRSVLVSIHREVVHKYLLNV